MNPMKKTIALLLALFMMLSVSGCAESLKQIEIPPLPQVTPTPGPVAAVSSDPVESSESPAPTGEAPAPTAGQEIILPATAAPAEGREAGSSILVGISRTELSENDPAEGTELILSFSYDMPRVLWEEKPAVASKINELLATVEETFYTGNDYGLELTFMGYNAMLETAEDNYAYVKEYQVEGAALEMTDSLSARIQRLDEGMLSFLYADSTFTGGAHGSYSQFGLSFDMESGELLTLDSLSDDPEALKASLLQIMLDLAEKDEDGYYSDRVVDSFLPEGGREEAFRNLLRDDSWYFDRDGMSMSWDPMPPASPSSTFPMPSWRAAFTSASCTPPSARAPAVCPPRPSARSRAAICPLWTRSQSVRTARRSPWWWKAASTMCAFPGSITWTASMSSTSSGAPAA